MENLMRKLTSWLFAALLVLSLLLGTACSEAKYELDDGDGELYQLEMPENGETIAILHTTLGDLTVRFFEEDAPKAVKNFITHAKNGYYDGCEFFFTEADFVIQSGNPENNFVGGESIWGKDFEDEFSPKLHHLYGALSMANNQEEDTNGSQFFFVANKNISAVYTFDKLQSLQKENKAYGYTDKINAEYQSGGCPWLDRKHTVFGQIIDGWKVMDKISRQETDEEGKPVVAVVIESIEVTTYQG